jgi:DNA polymerase-3 subunit gamma/tau
MSLALYRKYRPASFAELKGQEHVAEPLQQALRNGRVHHAYLFSGPRGCGKTSSARILARSLNCERGPTADPCGHCESCAALGPAGAGHIDVIEIDAASHGGVDDARDLRERAFFAPVASRYKIYIIDEAHMVTREGFNALLKLVEEPPPHLKFVFATTEPEKVIGTIRSRTHHYPFRLLPPGTLRELLEEILDAEKVPYEPAALPLVVRAGAGSARDSLSILDQLLAGADESGITHIRAVSLLGYTDATLLDEVVDAIADRDGAAVFAAVDRVIESGQDPRRFAADLLERFRDLIVLCNVADAGSSGLLDVPPDELERMRSQAGSLGPAELSRTAELLHTGLTEMRGATSPRLLLELICARVLLPGASDDEASLLTRLERLERRLAIGASGTATQHAGPPPAPPAARPPTETPQPTRSQPKKQPPPARGGDPNPIVEQGGQVGEGGGRSVDNEAAGPGRQGADRPRGTGGAGVRDTTGAAGHEDNVAGGESGAPVGAGDTGDPSAPAQEPAHPVGSADPAAPGAAPGALDVAAVRHAWPDVLEAVKRHRRVAWMILVNDVQVAALNADTLTLAFARAGDMKGWTSSGSDAALRAALTDVLGVDWRIEAVSAASSGGSRPSGAAGGTGSTGGRASSGSSGAAASGPGRSTNPTGTARGARGSGSGNGGSGRGPADGPRGHAGAASPAGAPGASGTGGTDASRGTPEVQGGHGSASGTGAGGGKGHRPGAGTDWPRTPRPRAGDAPYGSPPPVSATPVDPADEADEVDPEGDADADDPAAEVTGVALIRRELGGEIIDEIHDA